MPGADRRRLGQEPQVLTRHNAEALAGTDLPQGESFTFPGWNGEAVQGWVFKPAGYVEGRRYPAVYLIHGGPKSPWTDGWSYRWNPQIYTGRGLSRAVISISTARPGFGQKSEFHRRHDLLRTGRWRICRRAGLGVLAANAFIDGDRLRRVTIAGKWNGPWRCLVNHAGVFDVGQRKPQRHGHRHLRRRASAVRRGPRGPVSRVQPQHLRQRLVQTHVVLHGSRDFRVPVSDRLGTLPALKRGHREAGSMRRSGRFLQPATGSTGSRRSWTDRGSHRRPLIVQRPRFRPPSRGAPPRSERQVHRGNRHASRFPRGRQRRPGPVRRRFPRPGRSAARHARSRSGPDARRLRLQRHDLSQPPGRSAGVAGWPLGRLRRRRRTRWRIHGPGTAAKAGKLAISEGGANTARWSRTKLYFLSGRSGTSPDLARRRRRDPSRVQVTDLALDVNAYRLSDAADKVAVSLACSPSAATSPAPWTGPSPSPTIPRPAAAMRPEPATPLAMHPEPPVRPAPFGSANGRRRRACVGHQGSSTATPPPVRRRERIHLRPRRPVDRLFGPPRRQERALEYQFRPVAHQLLFGDGTFENLTVARLGHRPGLLAGRPDAGVPRHGPPGL